MTTLTASPAENIRRNLRYTVPMFQGPNSSFSDFVVTCKRCRENIEARIQTLPDSWIIETCPFCEETRGYLQQEIFGGRLSYKYAALRVRHGA